MARFLENLVYGTPWYILSDTPDGRIVGELHKGRNEASEYQRQSLSIQEQALKEIKDLHGGQINIPIDQFKPEQTRDILYQVVNEVQGLQHYQARTTEAIGQLGRITEEGLNQIHGDLRDSKGPDYPSETIDDSAEFFTALSAYSKGILNTRGRDEVESYFWKGMQYWQKQASNIQQRLINSIAAKGGEMDDSLREALLLLERPVSIIRNPAEAYRKAQILSSYAIQFNQPHLTVFTERVGELLQIYGRAMNAPLSEDMLVKFSNGGFLSGPAQHYAMEQLPEARKGASLTAVNYNLLDIVKESRTALRQRDILVGLGAAAVHADKIQIEQNAEAIGQREMMVRQGARAIAQREGTNYRLDSIIGNLMYVNNGIVNLGQMLEDFMGTIDDSLEQINETLETGFKGMIDGLDNIAVEVAITRAAAVAELRNIGNSIATEGLAIRKTVDRSNTILERIAVTMDESHSVEARQHFIEGKTCLEKAETKEDVEDAYEAFSKGIGKLKTSIGNYFGAAICAEILGKPDVAGSYYAKAARRADDLKKEFASLAYEQAARVEKGRGNLPEAIENIKKGVALNPKNHSARFSYAKYLALMGMEDEALDKIIELAMVKDSYIMQFSIDSSFDGISAEKKMRFYQALWREAILRAPKTRIHLFEVMMGMDDEEMAVEVLLKIFDEQPQALIEAKIWANPQFKKCEVTMKTKMSELISQNINLYPAQQCYQLFILALELEIDDALCVVILRVAVEQDIEIMTKDVRAGQKVRERLEKISPTTIAGKWKRFVRVKRDELDLIINK